MGRKWCQQTFCFQKFVDNIQQCFAFAPQANFPDQNLHFHWRWRWWDWIQDIFLDLFYFNDIKRIKNPVFIHLSIMNKKFSSISVCRPSRTPTRTFFDIEKKKSSSSLTQKSTDWDTFLHGKLIKMLRTKITNKHIKYWIKSKNIS